MCFIFRRTVSGLVEHLFLNTRLTSKALGTCLNSDLYSSLFLFFSRQILQLLPGCQCLVLWLWLKDKGQVFSDSMYPYH